MTSLMDLPVELLIDILERVGGRELRRGRGAARLSLCRTWYAVAHPVYLSGLGTTDIRLYGHDIDRITGKLGYSGSRLLMHKNTRRVQDGECPSPYLRNYPPPELIDDQVALNQASTEWRNVRLRGSLNKLFSDMHNFETLETLCVEAGCETQFQTIRFPQRDYLHGSTMSILMANLPIMQNLATFTLDTFGTNFTSTAHMCDELALVIPHIKTVRLRMKWICPKIFNLQGLQSKPTKLEHLTIKLQASAFDHAPGFHSLLCAFLQTGFSGSLEAFAKSSQKFVRSLTDVHETTDHQHETQVRISFSRAFEYHSRFAIEHDSCFLDGSTLQTYSLRDAWAAWNDDGSPAWFEFADSISLVAMGTFKPRIHSRTRGRTRNVAQLAPLTSAPGPRAKRTKTKLA
ncbi:hypothetical protein TI39_contig353g00048 [Zymoseptoria brevis]|uniref:F-box domain-containing protein n=1 Tax=Zymoseptoria brevis TaxID=1047168 RepID=A0A0F4GU30_9PEZI|nr:hypothetical protein TI39_contig353g00048 [Zymoseptoria brevis]